MWPGSTLFYASHLCRRRVREPFTEELFSHLRRSTLARKNYSLGQDAMTNERRSIDSVTGRLHDVRRYRSSDELVKDVAWPEHRFVCLLAWDAQASSTESVFAVAKHLIRTAACMSARGVPIANASTINSMKKTSLCTRKGRGSCPLGTPKSLCRKPFGSH